jgi:hypothetical protein
MVERCLLKQIASAMGRLTTHNGPYGENRLLNTTYWPYPSNENLNPGADGFAEVASAKTHRPIQR